MRTFKKKLAIYKNRFSDSEWKEIESLLEEMESLLEGIERSGRHNMSHEELLTYSQLIVQILILIQNTINSIS